MKISVIIPTLNEEVLLPQLLQDFKAQTFKDFEVIVADAGSKDQTRQLAQGLGAQVVDGGMPGVGRNAGAVVAHGQFLLFMDADVRLTDTFLADAYGEIEARYLDLATCELRPISDQVVDHLLHDFANLAVKVGQYTDPRAPGACIFVSRRLYDRIVGFDESLTLAEDHDFVKRASKFRSLRVLKTCMIDISVRRFEKEGRTAMISKYIAAELHRALLGKIDSDRIEYTFGDFTEEEQVEIIDQGQSLIHNLNQRYEKLVSQFKSGQALRDLPAESFQLLSEQLEIVRKEVRSLLHLKDKE